MQEEVTQKTIALSMKTGKLTAQALQAALKKYLQHRAKGPKLHHGKQSLKQLKAHEQIRQIQHQHFFQFRLHRSSPLCLILSFARFGCWAAFCLAAASTLRIEGRCSLVSVLAVNSRNACSKLSASLALKITM